MFFFRKPGNFKVFLASYVRFFSVSIPAVFLHDDHRTILNGLPNPIAKRPDGLEFRTRDRRLTFFLNREYVHEYHGKYIW